MANKEGRFIINNPQIYDSIKISVVGYHSKTLNHPASIPKDLDIGLDLAPAELGEVVIRKTPAIEIINRAIDALPVLLPDHNFENKGFYREIIRDKESYFSIAEAVFLAQYFPKSESYKLKLLQGRSKEDVAYTRLFEDFHPGGGPQSVTKKSLTIELPDFMNKKKLKFFNYKIDSLVQFSGRWLYTISFDQKPGVKESLEKGKIFIDADTYAIAGYEATNSPLGTPYIKDLTGTDKIFANLLKIDFQRKGWKNRVDFSQVNGAWVMSHAETEFSIGYKQPKKGLDLDLTIKVELLFSELNAPLTKEITKNEEWQRKNIAANLPTAFDADFWGENDVISPTQEVQQIIASINNNNGLVKQSAVEGWQYRNRNLFVAYQGRDTVTLIPIMRGRWEDGETGGMLYKEMEGDFIVESKINLSKQSDPATFPDRGFQQAGIMIRCAREGKENYFLLSIGTGGNPNPKLFLNHTVENKTKTIVDKVNTMNGWLKIEIRGNKLLTYYRNENEESFRKKGDFKCEWLTGKIEVGLVVFAAFSGNGPKMKPDLKASYSEIEITRL